MRWGHATRLPKPPYADSRRHSGVNASILARAPRGNRPPEWSTILAQGLLRPARRSQSCLHTPIRTPVSLHRNLLFAEVLRRPVESALGRPVKPGDDRGGGANGARLLEPRLLRRLPQMLHQLLRRLRQRPEAAGADRKLPIGPGIANPHPGDPHRAGAALGSDLPHHGDADAASHHLADRMEIVEPRPKPQSRAEPRRVPGDMR